VVLREEAERPAGGHGGVLDDATRRPSWETQLLGGSKEFIRIRKGSLFRGTLQPGVCGLRNLGNTCFLNSAVQCLSNTAPLTDFFIGAAIWQRDINKQNPLGTKGKLATEYAKLLRDIWFNNGKPITPRNFKNTVSSYAPMFRGFRQHDSQELLVFLLDGLHEDLNRVVDRKYVEVPDANGRQDEVVAAEHWANHLMRNKSIIVDITQGQIRSSLTCHECNFESVTFDPFTYLSLPFPDTSGLGPSAELSIDELLEEFTKPEHLKGDEAWYCPKCKDHVEATKKLDLYKLPPILVIHLKRFSFRGSVQQKIGTKVNFPIRNFNLDKFVRGGSRDQPHYGLYAVCRHMGTAAGGHYVAIAKNRVSHEWHCYDDSTCRVIEEDQVPDSSAYVLFFQNHIIPEQGYRRQSVSRPEYWPHELPKEHLDDIRTQVKQERLSSSSSSSVPLTKSNGKTLRRENGDKVHDVHEYEYNQSDNEDEDEDEDEDELSELDNESTDRISNGRKFGRRKERQWSSASTTSSSSSSSRLSTMKARFVRKLRRSRQKEEKAPNVETALAAYSGPTASLSEPSS